MPFFRSWKFQDRPWKSQTGLDAPERVQEVGPVSDAKATLLAKLKKMAERMRPPEIAAPLKDVTPLVRFRNRDGPVEHGTSHHWRGQQPSVAIDSLKPSIGARGFPAP